MQLTEEQKQVIAHPDGHHGKVLAVAGSGKTTTMAYRILHLIRERGVNARQIQVLMFNRLARMQFVDTLARIGLTEGQQPAVNTFHSYAYGLIDIQGFKQWYGKTEDLIQLCLLNARRTVCKHMRLDPDDIDLEEAERAISLWKGALIPPSQAGYRDQQAEAYIALYKEFEQARLHENAITFDDFVPMAVHRLKASPDLCRGKIGQIRYLIVDEYQDVNLGQQRLVEILAGAGSDVMVVGDDDQTIYEWRGARSDYILGEFDTVFTNKPHRTYRLTRSFRFGYCIAQSSYNVIQHNSHRLEKYLISSTPESKSEVTVITDPEEQGGYANRRLAEEIISLVQNRGVAPADIKVLGRTYAQFDALQTEFLFKGIPFKVTGRAPFLQAGESRALLNYVRVAAQLDKPLIVKTCRQFQSIANKPSRYLARRSLEAMLEEGRYQNWTLDELLQATTEDPTKFNRGTARENLIDLMEVLHLIQQKLASASLAGPLLAWIDNAVGFREHYENYYGSGEASLIRMAAVDKFIEYARRTELKWDKFIEHVDNTDTTQGRPEHEWIKMMTIHSAKGLEFDYVIIPDCKEGYLPVIGSNEDPTFDMQAPRQAPQAAEWIENERRLFYVGATRARKELFIGAPELISPQQEKQAKEEVQKSSRFLEEMELRPTRDVAKEVRRAAAGNQEHRLIETCRRWSTFHHIIGRVKEEYARILPRRLRPMLAQVELSEANRPFGYRQQYASPYDRNRSNPASNSRTGHNSTHSGAVWSHLNTRLPRYGNED